jgi:hypothetical protein
VRESRDSDAHPESLAIAIALDITGSMNTVPRIVQKNLPQLMGLLLRKGYVAHPQILFAAVGDAYCDDFPIQVGQFESGLEMEDNLTNVVLEGGGGGQTKESYELTMYFLAHKTQIDCFEKRGHKGFVFIIGDEQPYEWANREQLRDLLGETVEAAVDTAKIVAKLQERYHVFFIIPTGASYTTESWLSDTWKKLLGPEHVIKLADPEAVCETIAMTIGLVEGTAMPDRIAADLSDVGASATIVGHVASALDPLAKSTALAPAGVGNLPERTDSGATRV